MGILGDLALAMGNGALESAALRSQGIGVPIKKGRKMKTKGQDANEGCTPCAAMARVDATRKRLGYSIT